MITTSKFILVFDLDDTLYKEIDFLKSAYKEISSFLAKQIDTPSELIFSDMLEYYESGVNVFEEVIKKYNIKHIDINDLILIYRHHTPEIYLKNATEKLLMRLKEDAFKVCLITDGRIIQQRSKIHALGLSDYFDDVVISEEFGSEKPNMNNFKYFEDTYGDYLNYIYIGDNTKKDFIAPNNLGWHTICLLDDGHNIHKQSFDINENQKPSYIINDLLEIEVILTQIKNGL